MRAWLYYRLSRDEDEEMNSLQNQRQILIDYAEQNGYEVVGESFDDNVSGMTFNRKRIGDREHAQVYNSMIAKREEEIAALEKKTAELRKYDKVCKQRKEQLTSTSQILDEILTEGKISDVNLRMLVNKVSIHQNEDKTLDIKFDMNGDFNEKVI